jgi:hypothetical protein
MNGSTTGIVPYLREGDSSVLMGLAVVSKRELQAAEEDKVVRVTQRWCKLLSNRMSSFFIC